MGGVKGVGRGVEEVKVGATVEEVTAADWEAEVKWMVVMAGVAWVGVARVEVVEAEETAEVVAVAEVMEEAKVAVVRVLQ